MHDIHRVCCKKDAAGTNQATQQIRPVHPSYGGSKQIVATYRFNRKSTGNLNKILDLHNNKKGSLLPVGQTTF